MPDCHPPALVCGHPEVRWPEWNWSCPDGTESGAVCTGTCQNADHIEQKIQCVGQEWNMTESVDYYCISIPPIDEEPCPTLQIDPMESHGSLHCTSIFENKKVVKTCVLDCHTGYVPSSGEIFLCSQKEPIKWTLRDGITRIYSESITCERPIALLAGGKFLNGFKNMIEKVQYCLKFSNLFR